MLSNVSRWLTYLLALLYAVLGFLPYFFHVRLAPVFAWSVTPFMTMTIGGWCLGNAWLAWIKARRWQWSLVFSTLGLILFITAAAFFPIGLFDFAARPGGLLYFAAYLVVGIPLLYVFRKYGTGAPG